MQIASGVTSLAMFCNPTLLPLSSNKETLMIMQQNRYIDNSVTLIREGMFKTVVAKRVDCILYVVNALSRIYFKRSSLSGLPSLLSAIATVLFALSLRCHLLSVTADMRAKMWPMAAAERA